MLAKNIKTICSIHRSLLLWAAFCFYIFAVLCFTLLYGTSQNEIHLIPFEVIFKQWNILSNGNALPFVLNVLGNIALFVPFGFFLPLLMKTKFFKTSLCGFLFSLIIELIQLPLERVSDVDDLILNTLGTILGFLVFVVSKVLYLRFFANIENKKEPDIKSDRFV